MWMWLCSVHKLLFILIAAEIINMEYEKANDDDNGTAYVQLCLAKVSALDDLKKWSQKYFSKNYIITGLIS